jgi:SpoVK/Ycf46/Vps4 family AAA+-type ATPase
MMASGEVLVKLFTAFKENDDVEFSKIAFEIIEEEKRKNHNLLAMKLNKIMFDDSYKHYSKKSNINKQKQIPIDRDTGIELLDVKFTKKTLNDVILSDENQEKINNIINEYFNRDILKTYKLSPKTKILFCGPPGCGKTITAEAIASELQIPLLYTRFDSIVSSLLGETSTNLRKVFEFAKNDEWVLFFDEFDSIGKSREYTSEHSELKRVVNSYLQLMDNFNSDTIIISATNYENMIDKALWRRFDEIIFFDKPTEKDILRLLEKKFKSINYNGVNLNEYVLKFSGMAFSDIDRTCKEAIKQMILINSDKLTDKILNKVINNEVKRKDLIERNI